MKPIIRICLMLLLFISFLAGSFGIISYLTELALFENINYQLVIGIGSILIAIVCIVFLLKSPNEKRNKNFENELDKEIEKEIEREIEKEEIRGISSDELQATSELEHSIDNESESENDNESNDEEEDVIEVEKTVVVKDKLKNVDYDILEEQDLDGFTTNFDIVSDNIDKVIEEGSLDDIQDVLNNQTSESENLDELKEVIEVKNSEEETINNKENEVEVALQDSNPLTNDESVEEQKQDDENQSLDEKIAGSELIVNLEQENLLTETQITYIEQSDNSYLNTQGMPQLYMTDEMQAPRKFENVGPEVRVTTAEKEDKIDKFIRSSDPYEDLYVQEDNAERLINILVTVIICLSIACLIVGGYYLYTRFLG